MALDTCRRLKLHLFRLVLVKQALDLVKVAIEALGKLIQGGFKHSVFNCLLNFRDQPVLPKADLRDRLHDPISCLLVLLNFPLKVHISKYFLLIYLRCSLLHLFWEGGCGGLGRFLLLLHCIYILQARFFFLNRIITATFLHKIIREGADICTLFIVRKLWRLKLHILGFCCAIPINFWLL